MLFWRCPAFMCLLATKSVYFHWPLSQIWHFSFFQMLRQHNGLYIYRFFRPDNILSVVFAAIRAYGTTILLCTTVSRAAAIETIERIH